MQRPTQTRNLSTLKTVQEIAIYVHRFHNLDLFLQGWYQIRITVRWEDSNNNSSGFPAKVVQYEASDLGSDNMLGAWRIDDTDNSFSTPPFRIKYSRQDIHLCIMVAFNLSLVGFEGPSTSAAILKFELMYAPIYEYGADMQDSFSAGPAAIQEFRIPPQALLGLHSYCPVHFDAYYAVLVDVSVHVSLLKAASYPPSRKVHRSSGNDDVSYGETYNASNEGQHHSSSTDTKDILLIKAIVAARDILIEDLQKISKAVDQAIDLTKFISTMDDMKVLNSSQRIAVTVDLENSMQINDFEKLRSLSKDELYDCFGLLGDQILYLWSIFLTFHRANKTKLLEFFRDSWSKDRRTEWSIWMVHAKVDMPHHYMNGCREDPSAQSAHKKVSSKWKHGEDDDDPAHTAAMRAELHRRSISQMNMNSRSIQDMSLFGDPLRLPIITVQRVMNAPRRTFSDNTYLKNMGITNPYSSLNGSSSEAVGKTPSEQHGRVLKVVVFVHGFQGHHLDLRLVRNQWLLIDPMVDILMSEANEDRTSGDFREMGKRLAHEVASFVKKKLDRAIKSGRIGDFKLSFVGHSIGNLIIRTALTESIMKPYLRYLHTYVSISGPHLGYLYSSNSLFNSGLWLLKKFKGTQCIHQLTFTDDPDLRNTFLYKLCKQKTLDTFRHIVLLSSPQPDFPRSESFGIALALSLACGFFLPREFLTDISHDRYVPYHSARIESCQAASIDTSKKGKMFLEMLNNCMDQIRPDPSQRRVFMRCDVNFDASAYGKNLDSFIGRSAHIDFLESDIFARFIMWSFAELFR